MKIDQVLVSMQSDIDLQILELNFLEFLTNYLEGRATFDSVLQVNERIYARDTLSPGLRNATTTLHELKVGIDRRDSVDQETITTIVTDVVLELLDN